MARSVNLTTPVPTLDEVAKSLKIGKTRQKRLLEILSSGTRKLLSARQSGGAEKTLDRSRKRKGEAKPSAPPNSSGLNAASKKSKRAAAR
jgi:hypothetical protein